MASKKKNGGKFIVAFLTVLCLVGALFIGIIFSEQFKTVGRAVRDKFSNQAVEQPVETKDETAEVFDDNGFEDAEKNFIE